MAQRKLSALLCVAAASMDIARVQAASVLTLKEGSASCSGGMELNLLKTDQEYYTYGSSVSLSGQIRAVSDLPTSARIDIRLRALGMTIDTDTYNAEPCESNMLMPPAGYDAGYACPEAGSYNFFVPYTIPLDGSSFYSDWHGFNIAVSADVVSLDASEYEYASCSLSIHVSKNPSDTSSTNATLIAMSLVSLAGLATVAIRRRRRRLQTDVDPKTESLIDSAEAAPSTEERRPACAIEIRVTGPTGEVECTISSSESSKSIPATSIPAAPSGVV